MFGERGERTCDAGERRGRRSPYGRAARVGGSQRLAFTLALALRILDDRPRDMIGIKVAEWRMV
jgi:hypothetical protein